MEGDITEGPVIGRVGINGVEISHERRVLRFITPLDDVMSNLIAAEHGNTLRPLVRESPVVAGLVLSKMFIGVFHHMKKMGMVEEIDAVRGDFEEALNLVIGR